MTIPRPGARTVVSIAAVALVCAAGLLLVRSLDDRTGPAEHIAVPEMRMAPLGTATPSRPTWLAGIVAVTVDQPDGHAIAIMALGEAGGSGLLARGFDDIGHLAWSPDGERLAFAARRGANWDLHVVPRTGGEPVRLTDHAAFDGWPAWSPDGTRLAFESAREGRLAVYEMAAPTSGVVPIEPDVIRRSPADAAGPAIEPTWSPDGARIVYAIWDGDAAVYRIDEADVAGGSARTLLGPEPALDRRAPSFGPAGALVYREAKYGRGPVRSVDPGFPAGQMTVAGEADGYALSPGGEAIAFLSPGRRSASLEVRGIDEPGRWTLAELDPDTRSVAWAPGDLPAGLPPVAIREPGERWPAGRGGGVASRALGASAADDNRPGLVRLDDIDVSGPRINAAIKADFDALRAEIRSATGQDFLGTLSDMWRPIGFDSSRSAFYSWHKTGRAFDTFMSFTTASGGDGMVLVREGDGRPVWRMYLWAAVQDGSVGQPLREPGWHFSTSGWDDEAELREGGSRALRVPDGYWVDFTAAAARYGWQRIPAISRPGFDWRESFSAIEFWHYERRDGLNWHAAISEIYAPEEIEEALRDAPPRWGR